MSLLPPGSLPMPILRLGVIVGRAVKYFIEDDGAALAGYMAYTALLSLFPFLIFATSLSGVLIGAGGLDDVLAFLFKYAPASVATTIQPVLIEVVSNRSGSVVGLSAIGGLYIASNGVEALRIGVERAYGVSAYRPWWKARLIAVGFVFAGLLAFVVLALLIVFGPSIVDALLFYEVEVDLWTGTRYVIAAGILLAMLVAIHWFLPGMRPGVPILPGIVFTMAAWLLLASAFSIYFRYAPSYAVTYGTLGGVIATLLFFYVSAAIFIFGAEINSAAGAGENRERRRQGEAERDAPPVI